MQGECIILREKFEHKLFFLARYGLPHQCFSACCMRAGALLNSASGALGMSSKRFRSCLTRGMRYLAPTCGPRRSACLYICSRCPRALARCQTLRVPNGARHGDPLDRIGMDCVGCALQPWLVLQSYDAWRRLQLNNQSWIRWTIKYAPFKHLLWTSVDVSAPKLRYDNERFCLSTAAVEAVQKRRASCGAVIEKAKSLDAKLAMYHARLPRTKQLRSGVSKSLRHGVCRRKRTGSCTAGQRPGQMRKQIRAQRNASEQTVA